MAGSIGGIHITQGFLFAAAVLVEIPISMVLLSRVLNYRANRLANIVAGITMTAVQLLTLVIATPRPYYALFSIIEIACTSVIVWYAWSWSGEKVGLANRTDSLQQAPVAVP